MDVKPHQAQYIQDDIVIDFDLECGVSIANIGINNNTKVNFEFKHIEYIRDVLFAISYMLPSTEEDVDMGYEAARADQ